MATTYHWLPPGRLLRHTEGAAYSYADAGVTAGQTYWLEDIDLAGAATLHGPVSVDFVVPTAVRLGGVSASPAAGAIPLPWLWVVALAGAALVTSWMRR